VVASPPEGGARRADRLRRNPFVVIGAGFVLFLGVLEACYLLIALLLGDGGIARLVSALVVAPLAILAYRLVIVEFLEGRSAAPEIDWRPSGARWFLLGFGVAVGVLLVSLVLAALLGSVTFASGSSIINGLAAAAAVAILAAVVEELLARGILFRVTEGHLGSWLALVVSAVTFGLLHLANPDATVWTSLAIALEAGVSLGAIYMVARTLWAPIGMHAGWNFSQSFLGLDVSGSSSHGVVDTTLGGPDWLTGGAFGLEGAPIVVLLWLMVSVLLLSLAVDRRRVVPFRRARAASRASAQASAKPADADPSPDS
jgi:uncharacterized protein